MCTAVIKTNDMEARFEGPTKIPTFAPHNSFAFPRKALNKNARYQTLPPFVTAAISIAVAVTAAVAVAVTVTISLPLSLDSVATVAIAVTVSASVTVTLAFVVAFAAPLLRLCCRL